MKKPDSRKELSLSGMSDKTKQERHYRRIENFYRISLENSYYSVKRIDLMIIALSVGGIIVLLNFYKFNLENRIENHPLLLWSMALFMITIGCNFLAQWTSYKCNTIESKWAESEMDRLNEEIDKNEIGDSDDYDTATTIFNYLSYSFLVISSILLFCVLA